MLKTILHLIEYLILIYLTIQVAYLLFFSILGKITKKKIFPKASKLRKIRIFVPGYKEDSVIIATAKNILEQDYPKELFEVVIIADSFSESTLKTLNSLPIQVVEVHFEKSTKGKALQKAVEATQHKATDILLILDADNHIGAGFYTLSIMLLKQVIKQYKGIERQRIFKHLLLYWMLVRKKSTIISSEKDTWRLVYLLP